MGVTNKDTHYRTRQIAAEKEGLLWGAYHFGTYNNGVTQAKHFLNTVGNTSNTLLALDIEPSLKSKTIMSLQQVEDFVETVQNMTNNVVMIYGSVSVLKNYNSQFLIKQPLWIAYYNSPVKLPIGWNKWVIWQYTDGKKGSGPYRIKGVGICDRNKFNGSIKKLKTYWPNYS